MIDTDPIMIKLTRLANDSSVDPRHRRIVQETARIMKLMREELSQFKEVDELFEKNERLQQVLAEELNKNV